MYIQYQFKCLLRNVYNSNIQGDNEIIIIGFQTDISLHVGKLGDLKKLRCSQKIGKECEIRQLHDIFENLKLQTRAFLLLLSKCCSSVVVDDDQEHHVGRDLMRCFRLWLINPIQARTALPHFGHWRISWAGGKEIALDLRSSRFL